MRIEAWYESEETVRALSGARVRAYTYVPFSLPSEWVLIREKETPVTPLTGKTADDVLLGFRDTVRNEVRRTFSLPNVLVAIVPFSSEHYQLYKSHVDAQGRGVQPFRSFRDLLCAEARLNGVLVSVISFVPAKPIVKVFSISSSRVGADKETATNIGFLTKRLVYELCVWGIEHKYDGVDLAYVNTVDPAKKGITDFKMGFGGEVRKEYQYERASKITHFARRFKK